MYSNFKSSILDLKNYFIKTTQNTKFAGFVSGKISLKMLDNSIFASLIAMLFAFAYLSSSLIGLFAFVFMILTATRLFLYKGETLKLSALDVLVLIFYLFAFVSLMGSSEFILSFKGFLKLFLYISFYFCFTYWIRQNKDKIFYIFLILAGLTVFESLVAIIQNFSQIEAISGWQDTSNLNAEEVISRAYGTLKPYNPNLLAGFLVVGLSFISYFTMLFLENKSYKRLYLSGLAILITILAIFYTGCRGAYIALFPLFIFGTYFLKKYTNKYYGGFSSIKKRYKNIIYGIFGLIFTFIILNPAIYKRILSIFAFRGDSSISFRMNVYKSCFEMFMGNPFIGIGLGNQNFREIYGLYMLTGFDALSAYNIFLEIACEMGIFGLITFLQIIIYAFYIAFGFIKNSNNSQDKILILSIILGISIILVHGLTDTIFYRPQVQTIFWMFFGILNATIFNEVQNS